MCMLKNIIKTIGILFAFVCIGAGCIPQANLPNIFSSSSTTPPPTTTSTDTMPPTTTINEKPTLQTFVSEIGGFELQYPTKMVKGITPGPSVLYLSFPPSDLVNTTLIEATINVEFNTRKTIAACTTVYTNVQGMLQKNPTDTMDASTSTMQKNNLEFFRSTSENAGAGSLYHTTTYELFNNQKCFSFTLKLQSPIDINSTKTAPLFNKQPFIDVFEDIISSFKLLLASSTVQSNTPTATQNMVLTLNNNNNIITLNVGDAFLINLGDDSYEWTMAPNNSSMISLVKNTALVKGAQGLYRAEKIGETELSFVGEPLCRKSTPACTMPSKLFRVKIIVK